jgi:hypothetical protein
VVDEQGRRNKSWVYSYEKYGSATWAWAGHSEREKEAEAARVRKLAAQVCVGGPRLNVEENKNIANNTQPSKQKTHTKVKTKKNKRSLLGQTCLH